jgi:8-hydroxy-5-deazaflavin:NADPH oxidoreductase
MNIAIFGTGVVGQTLAKALSAKGDSVTIGTRDPAASKTRQEKGYHGESFSGFHAANPRVSVATFADAAKSADIILNCTNGGGTLAALELAGASNLGDKLLLDISNPLDFSKGMPPTLSISNHDSLGEQVQRAYPNLQVVKTLNTMSCDVMIDPSKLKGDHVVFVGGNASAAKDRTKSFLTEKFGWKSGNIIDLGDISTSRGTEQYLPLWIRLFGVLQTGSFNINIVR